MSPYWFNKKGKSKRVPVNGSIARNNGTPYHDTVYPDW
jgi:hypothetical protein